MIIEMKERFLTLVVMLLICCVSFAQPTSDTLMIPEVVITGARVEVARNTLPVNITVVDHKQMNEIEESAVLPLLSRMIPGLFVTERGVTGFGVGSSSAGQVSIRGVGGAPNTQVLMLVDGQPQYMGIFGHPLPNSYVVSEVERVEVIRGPGSMLYGSNAMGGVINLITRKQQKDGFSGNARLAYGSFNTSKLMFNGGYRKNGFHVFASLNRDDTDGHRNNSSFTINNTFVKVGYEISPNLEVTADYNLTGFNNVDPGRDFANDEPFRADIVRGRASLAIKNNYQRVRGGLITFYNFGDHDLSDGWRSNDENFGVSLYQGVKLPLNSEITLGTDLKQFGGRGNSGVAANAWNTVNESGVYAMMRHNLLQVLHISYGIRLENNSLYGNEWIPQAGVAWQALPQTSLKASVAKGFRSPTVMETYLFMPNPALEPERMMSYEAGISQNWFSEKLHTSLSVFLINGSNMIMLVPNPASPPPSRRVNVGEFTNKGFELECNYYHSNALSLRMSYAYLDTQTPLLAAPEHQFFAGANYQWYKFRLSLQGQYIGGLYSYLHNPQQGQTSADNLLENYLVVNSSVSWKPAGFAEVFISGRNLLNQTYQINNGYPMPGINFMTGVNVSF